VPLRLDRVPPPHVQVVVCAAARELAVRVPGDHVSGDQPGADALSCGNQASSWSTSDTIKSASMTGFAIILRTAVEPTCDPATGAERSRDDDTDLPYASTHRGS
jgi:hypothetical protein